METTLNYKLNSKSFNKTGLIISIISIIITFIALMFGNVIFRSFQSFLTQQSQNFTFAEGVIALLNIALAVFVISDAYISAPAEKIADNPNTSKSFIQFLRGWILLWFVWILLYFCLAVIWFQSTEDYKSQFQFLADFFNMLNGFCFFFLFFVLDQQSVDTELDKKRAKSFHRNVVFTLLLGVIALIGASVPFLIWSNILDKNAVLISKLVAAYAAVGMAFFFGRLDSHYLNIHRVILAPLYLYAVIQLFWSSGVSDTSEFNPDRVAIFLVALVLKIAIFYFVSKGIKDKSFYHYLIDAEKGFVKKRKLEIAISEIKENESILSIYIQPNNNLETIAAKLDAINSIYTELCQLLNVSTTEYPLKVIMIESGSLWVKLFGESKIIGLVTDFLREGGKYIYYNHTKDGRNEKEIINIEKKTALLKNTVKALEEILGKEGLTHKMEKDIKKSGEKITHDVLVVCEGQKNGRIIDENFSSGSVIDKVIEEHKEIH
jgi:hypothetical protein